MTSRGDAAETSLADEVVVLNDKRGSFRVGGDVEEESWRDMHELCHALI